MYNAEYKNMDKVKILVIGAGAVGLAIAEKLSGKNKDILVIECHDSFGRETSSRNSEVIHAGLYNPKSSLKTGLCIRGRSELITGKPEKSLLQIQRKN